MMHRLSRSKVSPLSTIGMVLLFAALALAGCSNDPEGDGDTGTPSDTSVHDTGIDAFDADDAADSEEQDADDASDIVVDGGDDGFLCDECTDDSECGGAEDRCLTLLDERSVCTSRCDPSAESPDCPDSYTCATVDSQTGEGQCVPEKLTCVDRCSQKTCEGNEKCDPITGECRAPLGLCDTGCTLDEMCGDGPEDRCLNVPGTIDGERMCATGCNPESETTECPVDFSCVPLDPENNPEDGVCFPLKGTCKERCANEDCDDGENCNVRTGQCEEATYGACEKGCQRSAQCGGQKDVCLDLGIGDGSHCWLDCSDGGDTCPENYRCAQLTNTTLAICIPEAMRCEQCYDQSCFPGGACDPETGMCRELEKDCTVSGCSDGEACDPRSTQCVEVGRSCSGDSWAADCDNIVTACTTRRSGTDGTCERICASKADCSAGESCVTTNLRKMCLGSDFGGPLNCGTLHDTSSDVGAPCNRDGDCPSGAPTCVDGGGIDGFCSYGCQTDGDCDADQRCETGPGGAKFCVPTQCDCAVDPGFGSDWSTAFNQALGQAGIGRCDIWQSREDAGRLTELSETPLADGRIEERISLPLTAQKDFETELGSLDSASDTPGSAIEAAASASGLQVTGQAGSYSFGGSPSKLTQAVSKLITASGGTPNTSQLEMAAQNVPTKYQDVAAPIIAAAADAYTAREAALAGAGWMSVRRSEAFDAAPYLFLPGTTMQESSAPDLSQASVRKAYGFFPRQKLAKAAADLAATVEAAKATASGASSWTGFTYVVDTPAGKVVLGDAGNTTFDPSQNGDLQGDIAVLIDAAGDDTYRLPVGANTSVANGVALAVDLGGSDTYTYDKVGDPKDTVELLTSDADGRKMPAGSLAQNNGPVSLSTTGRQGAGRVGIGMLVDYGADTDSYESLRISQGASVFGVGLLFDGGGDDTFEAEALSQGAALGGLGILWNVGGVDSYKVWHAGQGFGAAAGTGVLFERAGDDTYTAVQGQTGGAGVLYYSPADRGSSNRNVAQGAGAGIASTAMSTGLAGGYGLLRDVAGGDSYTAGTYAQGFGAVRGLGLLADATGKDAYDGRVLVQAAGQFFGGGTLRDGQGNDTYNASVVLQRDGQGFGEAYGWGLFWEAAGIDDIAYGSPGGGVGIDGGFGFAFSGAGKDEHTLNAQAGWGFAENSAMMGDPLAGVTTLGFFVDVGAASDNYTRPQIQGSGIGNGSTWLQPDPATDVKKGVGIDQ